MHTCMHSKCYMGTSSREETSVIQIGPYYDNTCTCGSPTQELNIYIHFFLSGTKGLKLVELLVANIITKFQFPTKQMGPEI